jgi:hypothetical protein
MTVNQLRRETKSDVKDLVKCLKAMKNKGLIVFVGEG